MRYESVNKKKLEEYTDFIPAGLIPGIMRGDYRVVGVTVFNDPSGALVWEPYNGKAAGALKSIFVKGACRRIGAGETLLTGLNEDMRESKIDELEFEFSPEGDSYMLLPFFEAMNINVEHYYFPFASPTLEETTLALEKKKLDRSDSAGLEFSNIKGKDRNLLSSYLKDNFHTDISDYLSPDTPSFAVIGEDSVDALLLIGNSGDSLSMDFLYQRGGDGRVLAAMLYNALKRYNELYDPDRSIEMILASEESLSLYRALFGEPEDRIDVCRGKIIGY